MSHLNNFFFPFRYRSMRPNLRVVCKFQNSVKLEIIQPLEGWHLKNSDMKRCLATFSVFLKYLLYRWRSVLLSISIN